MSSNAYDILCSKHAIKWIAPAWLVLSYVAVSGANKLQPVADNYFARGERFAECPTMSTRCAGGVESLKFDYLNTSRLASRYISHKLGELVGDNRALIGQSHPLFYCTAGS